MRAEYDRAARTLTIFVRPELEATGEIDYLQGTHAPVPLTITTGVLEDEQGRETRGYAVAHTWRDIDLAETLGGYRSTTSYSIARCRELDCPSWWNATLQNGCPQHPGLPYDSVTAISVSVEGGEEG